MTYEIVFEDSPGAQDSVPRIGEPIRIGGEVWEIKNVEARDADCSRIRLGQPAAEVEAHRAGPVKALAHPTSFESELVYTLSDLSTRLSSLSQVLTAYWGQGAA
jgi:hypothetical protein